jgi:hypothetical protein
MAGGIRFRHGVSLLLVITIALLSADPAGAGDRFPSRRRALAREHVIERSGTTAEEYRVGAAEHDVRPARTDDDGVPVRRLVSHRLRR